MNVKEMQERKSELEKIILGQIEKFSDETEATVTLINLTAYEAHDENRKAAAVAYEIRIGARLW